MTKYVEWNTEKNEELKRTRGLNFDDILNGVVIGVIPHPNQKRYSNQSMFVVRIADYVYLVPFVEDEEKIFLKTIFPSRKETKKRTKKIT